jgi:hypothetical protein
MADMMQMAKTVVQLEAALQAMKRLYGAKWGEKSALYRTVLNAAIRWERCTVLQAAIPLAKHMSDAGENPVMLLAVAAEMCQEQKEVVMSRPNSIGVRQCTPAWRHHKWVEIAMNKHGETRKVRCQHCDAEVLGIHKCTLAISQNETSKKTGGK